MSASDEERKAARAIAFNVSRVAHWLINDSGYTRKMAARELARIARGIDREKADESLGDAKVIE